MLIYYGHFVLDEQLLLLLQPPQLLFFAFKYVLFPAKKMIMAKINPTITVDNITFQLLIQSV